QLLSVPFALRAGKSSNVPDGTEVGQLMHWDGNTWVADSGLYVHDRRFGIGTNDPPSPFAIVHRNILKSFFATGDKPNQQQRGMGIGVDSTGFGFSEGHIDSLENRLFVQSRTGHVGIGTNDPPAPLAIESRSILKTYFQTGDIPTQDDFAFLSDSTGFSIDQGTPTAHTSRFFIQEGSGAVGIGTLMPAEKLHVNGAVVVGDTYSATPVAGTIRWNGTDFEGRTASDWVIFNGGPWQKVDNSDNSSLLSPPNARVGINEPLPFTTLHVSRPVADPNTQVSLLPNTGIAVIGPSSDNIVMDHKGIQARHGEYVNTTLTLDVADLNLQRLGGGVIVHGSSTSDASKLLVRDDGAVGIGTLDPMAKLHVSGANDGGNVGIWIENTAASTNEGWSLSVVDDNAVAARMKTFAIQEKKGSDLVERITILSSGNTGINEPLPNTTLHVTKPLSDPTEPLNLSENTGIAQFGPLEQHLVFDSRGIQARHLLSGGTSLTGSAGSLHLQPLGGGLVVHHNAASDESKLVVMDDGAVGIGTLTPAEKLEVNGAVVLGNSSSTTPVPGTIRFNGTDFEGRTASGDWAIFNGTVWQKIDNTDGVAVTSPPNAKVGIGTDTPNASLHVQQHTSADHPTPAQFVSLMDSNVNLIDDRELLGLKVRTQGSGSFAGFSKNVGLYVSDVSGQTAHENNIAAVLNGNVVIGDLHTQAKEVGANGTNVLAIQNGTAPA
ncbi:MAG TPA: hypothetical protein PK760_07870, partial [Flavobacteriales bacterium]|nr:hypothetical protein [Flavobacteriales bacterium]